MSVFRFSLALAVFRAVTYFYKYHNQKVSEDLKLEREKVEPMIASCKIIMGYKHNRNYFTTVWTTKTEKTILREKMRKYPELEIRSIFKTTVYTLLRYWIVSHSINVYRLTSRKLDQIIIVKYSHEYL